MSKSEGWDHLLSNRLAEARVAFLAEGGPDGLAGLGCTALPSGQFQGLWEPWSELIRRYPQHWSAAAVIPILVAAGGGLEAQEKLNALLKHQMANCSPEFASLAGDLLGTAQRLRWKLSSNEGKRRWHTMQPCADPSGCDLEQVNDYCQRRFYAATAFDIAEEIDTTLDCDLGSGEVRIWLNGQMVLRAERDRAHYWAGMPYRSHIHLLAGENHLLIQRDRPEYGEVNFRVRLGVRVARSRPAELSPSEHQLPPVMSWLLQSIPDECPIFRADYLFRLGLTEDASQHLAPWNEAYPESALLSWAAAKWAGFPRGKKIKIWQQRRRSIPEWNGPELLDCERFLASGRFPLEHGRAEVQHFSFSGSSPDLIYAPLVGAVQPRLSDLLARFPGHPWLLERRLSLMTPYSTPVDVEHIPEPELAEAARLMEALAKRHPNGWGWDYRRLADVHRRIGERLKASKYYHRAAKYRPWDPDVWETLADNEAAPAKAAKAYRKALKLSPERVDLRDRIEQCLGSAPLLETLAPAKTCVPSWDLLPEEVLWGQKVGFYDVCDSQHPARNILLKEMRQVVYSDGASYGCYRLIAETPEDRVFSPEFPQPMRRLRTGLRTSRLYRQDGRVQDTLDLSQGGWPAFPDCREGDVAEAAWSVSASGLGGFSQDWELGQSDRYLLIRPTDRPLQVSRPPDVSDTKENWTLDTWTSSGPLKVSTFSSWSELALGLRRRLLRPLGLAAEARARQLGSASAVVRWVEESDSEWDALWSQSEPAWRAMDRTLGGDASTAVLVSGLMRALSLRTEICFPLLDTGIPGLWFGKPTIKFFDQEFHWWRSPRPGAPLLSLSRGLIQMA